jgi:hypothetical protein
LRAPSLRPHLCGMDDKANRNEGEGSRSADVKYREAASDFARRADTAKAGLEAEREVEQRKGELEEAEQAGRARSKGDLESDLSGSGFDRK